jgi:protein gp37
MADQSSIEWTDATWSAGVRGCALTSPGCEHCYAMKFAHRFSGTGGRYEGLTRLGKHGPVWTGSVRLVPEQLVEPLRWKKGRRVFVSSMSDLFHEDVPDRYIAAVFGAMAACRRHTFQVLTKRAERMAKWFEWVSDEAGSPGQEEHLCGHAFGDAIPLGEIPADPSTEPSHFGTPWIWPLPNVWLGVSVENQEQAEARITQLLRVPAAVRFLSCEPLLGPVDLTRIGMARGEHLSALEEIVGFVERPPVDWVIVGGESGHGARPMQPDWARSLRDQCVAAGVQFHFKQWGEHDDGLVRIGKKAAGRLLDGRTWDGYPTPRKVA